MRIHLSPECVQGRTGVGLALYDGDEVVVFEGPGAGAYLLGIVVAHALEDAVAFHQGDDVIYVQLVVAGVEAGGASLRFFSYW